MLKKSLNGALILISDTFATSLGGLKGFTFQN